MALVISCNEVVKEANKINHISLELYEKLDTNDRNEILYLLTLVKAKKACYTAIGYFELSKSTLFVIFSNTITYFIILVQFYQQSYVSQNLYATRILNATNQSLFPM